LSVEVNVEVTSTVTVAVTLGVGIFRQLQAAEISQLGKDLRHFTLTAHTYCHFTKTALKY
jgi:hypothetical protein